MANTLKKAIFLDRDGVLNEPIVRDGRPFAPRCLEDFHIFPDAATAVGQLKEMGFAVVVATNQKDVGMGDLDPEVLQSMHDLLMSEMPIDQIKVCICIDECPCYKPNPGMLIEAADELGLDLSKSFMVGDRWRDVGAGRNAGCRTIFIDRQYSEKLRDEPDFTAQGIAEAVRIIEQETV